jgi:hypothetical protein
VFIDTLIDVSPLEFGEVSALESVDWLVSTSDSEFVSE